MKLATAYLLAIVALSSSAIGADSASEPAPWPWFHGPKNDNISVETGLLKKWPKEGPKLLWQSDDCGDGFSMFSFAEGKIFTSGDFGKDEFVIALNMKGELLWKTRNGKSWTGPYPGARTTPTYVDGVLHHMNPTGVVAAIKAATGDTVWSVDLGERFGVRHGIWALAENLVVDGDRVLAMPGGAKGRVVALNKNTGKTIWANTELDEPAAYCSPVLATHNGVRQYITLTGNKIISVDAKTGKLLWSHPHVTKYSQSINTPIYHDGHVFVATGHSSGGRLVKINPDGRGATEVWFKKELDSCHGGVILLNGDIYSSSCRLGGKIFFRANFLTGEIIHENKPLGKLSLTYADDRFYGINDKGKTLLIALQTTPAGFDTVSQFQLPQGGKGSGKYLSHPVIHGKRLYIRHWNHLYVYSIGANQRK